MSQKKTALEQYPDYKTDIGIEVHVQLNTESKIFCSCSNSVTEIPNSHICPICCGHPGVLPVFNKQVLISAIKAGLATSSVITKKSSFARKHYFYPDLPKNYQITQDKEPICTEGHIMITKEDGSQKKIRLIRIHIEEDAGKNIHADYTNESFIDFNRTGTPLLEIVSYPDIESAEEAKAYLKELRSIVQSLKISTGNMEEGSFRADTNISVRKKSSSQLGTRCELKNINSFKFIGDAIEYEIERHINLIENGELVVQQTRLWDTKNKISLPMRSKEEAADYRYFQDPDLPLIIVDETLITTIASSMPELPQQKKERLKQKYNLSNYEIDILVENSELTTYYETAYTLCTSKHLINWILRDVLGYMYDKKITLQEFKVTPEKLADIMTYIENETINNQSAKIVFETVAENGKNPATIIQEQGLKQTTNIEELERIIINIIESEKEMVAQYLSGKEKLFGFFVGLGMQKTAGKANPKIITELFKKHLIKK